MLNHITRVTEKTSLTAVGLMSGTSMDGVDAALVSMDVNAEAPTVFLREFISQPYPGELRDLLGGMASGVQITAEDAARAGTSVAVAFAGAFFEVCRRAGVTPDQVDFVGSHGQTVAHVPPVPGESSGITGTLQLGPPSMIAALTGVMTVGDFRTADMAVGGQGAPLAPLCDWLLRRSPDNGRVILNIGGIANLTWLPPGGDRHSVSAFDTGPGNMISDELYRVLVPDGKGFDEGGTMALSGSPNSEVVSRLMRAPFFAQSPPRSAGHREFGPQFAWQLHAACEARGLSREDALATAAMLTASAVADAVARFIDGVVDEMFVTGGGVHNAAIMSSLARLLPGLTIRPIDDLGIPASAKEAVDFALLARETLFGRPAALTQVTGASARAILGVIAPGGLS